MPPKIFRRNFCIARRDHRTRYALSRKPQCVSDGSKPGGRAGQGHANFISSRSHFWNARGRSTITQLPERILEESRNVQIMLLKLQEEGSSFSWRYSISQSLVGQARDLVRHIDKSVHGLYIYSNTVLNAMASFELLYHRAAKGDQLLRLAAESRAASQKLHTLCLIQTEDCNIELDLPGASDGICYRLVIRPGERTLQHVVVENVKEIVVSNRDSNGNIEFAKQDTQILEPSQGNKVIEVPLLEASAIDTDSPIEIESPVGMDITSYLLIPRERPAPIHLDHSPGCLDEILRCSNGLNSPELVT